MIVFKTIKISERNQLQLDLPIYYTAYLLRSIFHIYTSVLDCLFNDCARAKTSLYLLVFICSTTVLSRVVISFKNPIVFCSIRYSMCLFSTKSPYLLFVFSFTISITFTLNMLLTPRDMYVFNSTSAISFRLSASMAVFYL